jgi:hypothetical protein
VFAVVQAETGQGGFVRAEPGGQIRSTISNGTLVQVLPGAEEQGGQTWVEIIGPNNLRGWMLQSLLLAPTPTATPK